MLAPLSMQGLHSASFMFLLFLAHKNIGSRVSSLLNMHKSFVHACVLRTEK